MDDLPGHLAALMVRLRVQKPQLVGRVGAISIGRKDPANTKCFHAKSTEMAAIFDRFVVASILCIIRDIAALEAI